jgi:hypothetical protein
MKSVVSSLVASVLSLALIGSASAGYSYSSTKAGAYKRAGAAARAKVPGAERAATAGLTRSGKSWIVGVATKNGEVHRVIVNRNTGAARDQGDVVPEARQKVAYHVKFREGKSGFTVSNVLAPRTETVNKNQQLSTRGGVLRFGIKEASGDIKGNRLFRLRDKKVVGDSADREYTSGYLQQ